MYLCMLSAHEKRNPILVTQQIANVFGARKSKALFSYFIIYVYYAFYHCDYMYLENSTQNWRII